MIKKLDETFTKVNKIAGVNINIPKATKSRLKVSRIFTTIFGVGGLVTGIVGNSVTLMVLGSISIISSIVTTIEIRKF